jgi:hypothetical protein
VASPDWQPPPGADTIRSFRAYHNLFVIEKGDYAEPSSAQYNRDNPHVAHATTSIEREMSDAPTARGNALLALVYSLSGEHRKAADILERALARWSDNLRLLMIGVNVAERAGETAIRQAYVKRAAALDPTIASIGAFPEEKFFG